MIRSPWSSFLPGGSCWVFLGWYGTPMAACVGASAANSELSLKVLLRCGLSLAEVPPKYGGVPRDPGEDLPGGLRLTANARLVRRAFLWLQSDLMIPD
jgi:hypothetical protein